MTDANMAAEMADKTADALRELRLLHDFAHTEAAWDSCEACGIIRAAFATLDVERLADAIDGHTPEWEHCGRSCAPYIAREYAAEDPAR